MYSKATTSHRETTADICKNYLEELQLLSIFSESEFNSYYRPVFGTQPSAYKLGIEAADKMIHNINNSKKL